VEQRDLLVTAAQVAVGLAGFTGVASALGNRATDTDVQRLRLMGLLSYSLLAAAFSVLPLVLSAMSIGETFLWQIASAIYLAVSLSRLLPAWRRALPVARASQGSWYLVPSLLVAPNVFLFLGVFGFATPSPISCYVLAVYLHLVLSGLLFLRYFVRSGP
jgi:hypothetical protein